MVVMASLLHQPLPVRHVATVKLKPCQPMPANGFMNANPVMCFSNRKKATVACIARMAMCHAHQFSNINPVAARKTV